MEGKGWAPVWLGIGSVVLAVMWAIFIVQVLTGT